MASSTERAEQRARDGIAEVLHRHFDFETDLGTGMSRCDCGIFVSDKNVFSPEVDADFRKHQADEILKHLRAKAEEDR